MANGKFWRVMIWPGFDLFNFDLKTFSLSWSKMRELHWMVLWFCSITKKFCFRYGVSQMTVRIEHKELIKSWISHSFLNIIIIKGSSFSFEVRIFPMYNNISGCISISLCSYKTDTVLFSVCLAGDWCFKPELPLCINILFQCFSIV